MYSQEASGLLTFRCIVRVEAAKSALQIIQPYLAGSYFERELLTDQVCHKSQMSNLSVLCSYMAILKFFYNCVRAVFEYKVSDLCGSRI